MPSLPCAECFGHRSGNFCFRFDQLWRDFLRYRRFFPARPRPPLLGVPRLWRGRLAYRLRPGRPAAEHRCFRPHRYRRCRSRRSRRRFANRAAGQARLSRSGRGSPDTLACVSAEPMALTMPSPTRAMIVSSVAPPINCCRLARTVTRAFTFS